MLIWVIECHVSVHTSVEHEHGFISQVYNVLPSGERGSGPITKPSEDEDPAETVATGNVRG